MAQKKTSPAWLLIWNDSTFDWKSSNLESIFKRFQASGKANGQWSTGVNKSILSGDRVYLMKLGRRLPTGIVARGIASSKVYEENHWGTIGRMARYIDIVWTKLVHPYEQRDQILSYDRLSHEIPGYEWRPQTSGVRIPIDVANAIEKMWLDQDRDIDQINAAINSAAMRKALSEGELRVVSVRQRKRNLEARRLCLVEYGARCAVCSFDFEEFYGDIGKHFCHVHHLKPLHKVIGKQKVDPVLGLRPVCANCHAMLHKTVGAPLSIGQLKNKIEKVRVRQIYTKSRKMKV